MAEPTLTQVFGAGATQTATTLTLAKADFASVGLVADAANRAEQLFVALLLKVATYLNETNQSTNNDIQVTITPSFAQLVTRNNTQYRQQTYSVNLQRVDTAAAIDPDNY